MSFTSPLPTSLPVFSFMSSPCSISASSFLPEASAAVLYNLLGSSACWFFRAVSGSPVAFLCIYILQFSFRTRVHLSSDGFSEFIRLAHD